jgi:hypothetical protein
VLEGFGFLCFSVMLVGLRFGVSWEFGARIRVPKFASAELQHQPRSRIISERARLPLSEMQLH